MGFKARGSVQLVLPETLNGLVVLVKGRSVGEWLDGGGVDLSWEEDTTISDEEKRKRYAALYGDFVADVISWNLEDEAGAPIPIDMAGIRGVNTAVSTPMVSAWAFRRVKLPDPLDSGSANGSHSAPLSIPMEPLAPNPTS